MNSAMARPKERARDAAPVRGDFYEAEEIEPDEEKHAGQRYDVRATLSQNHALFVPKRYQQLLCS